MNDCNIPDKTELLDGECTGEFSQWSEWIDSSPQSKIDRTGSERELISTYTSASMLADTNLGLCGQSDILAAQVMTHFRFKTPEIISEFKIKLIGAKKVL